MILSKLGEWFTKYFLIPTIKHFWDQLSDWIEREIENAKQKKKDEENKKKYDEAIKNGDHKTIEDVTEDTLNG